MSNEIKKPDERAANWKDAFNERHQFDVYPDDFMTGLRNEFCAGWHAALKAARATAPQETFPYQKTFNAIAAATKVEAGHIAVSVAAFCKAFDAAAPQATKGDEPSAYLVTGGKTFVDKPFMDLRHAEKSVIERKDGARVEPLFRAAVPQAGALSDEQIVELAKRFDLAPNDEMTVLCGSQIIAFARALLAASSATASKEGA